MVCHVCVCILFREEDEDCAVALRASPLSSFDGATAVHACQGLLRAIKGKKKGPFGPPLLGLLERTSIPGRAELAEDSEVRDDFGATTYGGICTQTLRRM